MFNYTPEQEEIFKARAVKILAPFLPEEIDVQSKNMIMNHLTRVCFIKDNIFYTFFFWADKTPGNDPHTVPFSFEFSKGIPKTKILLSPILTMKHEPSFVNYLETKFMGAHQVYA